MIATHKQSAPPSSPRHRSRDSARQRALERVQFYSFDPECPFASWNPYVQEAALLAKVVTCRAAEVPPAPASCGQDIGRIWMKEIVHAPWYDSEKETLVALALDTQRQCRHVFLISMGTLNETLAGPREIFRPLIVAAAYTFVLCHNHPSGDPTPSGADLALSQKLRRVGQVMEIPPWDFVIFGQPETAGIAYYSLRETGQL